MSLQLYVEYEDCDLLKLLRTNVGIRRDMATHQVCIEEGWTAGTQQVVTFPGGQRVAIVIPHGVRPGQTIMVQAPSTAAPPPHAGPTVRVMVPAGCGE